MNDFPISAWKLIDAIAIASVVCDRDGRVARANSRALEFLALDLPPGAPFCSSVPMFDPDGRVISHADCPVTRAILTGMRAELNLCIERAAGWRIATRLSAMPLLDEAGAVFGVLTTFHEVSAETQPGGNNATLAAIVDSSDDAIVSKTLEGIITSWNSAAERMFGYTAAEATGRHISLIIPPDRLEEERDVLDRLRRGEKIDHFETVRRTKDGRAIEISLTVSPVRGSDGTIVGASKVARDVTERNSADRALGLSQRRYRRLFDSAGVSLWEEDLSAVKAALDEARRTERGDFREYLRRHPELVDRCLDLVRVVDVNRATLRLFGARTKQDLVNGLKQIFAESARDTFAECLVTIAEGRTQFETEAVLRTLSGDRVDVMMAVRFPEGDNQRDPDASFESVLISLTDITQRRLAEDTLRSEALIRETLANVGASFAAELDPERLVQAVTEAAAHVTAAEFGAFLSHGVTESGESYQLHAVAGAGRTSFSEELNPEAARLLSQTFRGEGIVRIADVTGDPQYASRVGTGAVLGHVRLRSYLAVPVVSRSREILGGLLFGHSEPSVFTTHHERLAAGIASWAALALDNARLYKAAQDANATKDEFLATLSHELRTPLNAMLGWTHLLRSGSLANDMRQRALEALERNGRAQAQLIDDLLDVSRIVSGRLQLKADDVELGSVVASAIDTIRPAAAAKELTVRLLLPDRDVIVGGDADRLRQIFWNLLSNAVKFTPARGVIEVELLTNSDGAEVQVRDTGMGIRRDFLRHVFERFRQADSSHSRQHGGLGLGLAIVRHLVEAHGGTVAVDSPGEGQGATFSVRLPVRSLRRPIKSSSDSPIRQTDALEGLHVLVVDDERDAREFLAALLSMHGAQVELASSAGEALSILANLRIDVLLADLGLPDRDGYALIQAVRSLGPESGGSVPAVAVTAYAGLRERTRAFEAGYGWHVAKPVDPDQLLAVVTTAAGSLAGTNTSDVS